MTQLLQQAAEGEAAAAARLLPLVYEHLRALARSRMRHVPAGNTLQPTALVHEAYARLVSRPSGDPGWPSRGRFFAAAATAMRDILVEQARQKAAQKHGGGRRREELGDVAAGKGDGGDGGGGEVGPEHDRTPVIESPSEDMLALDAALRVLEGEDPRKASVVMLKYFAGLEIEQIALALGVSVPTVNRDWAFAKAWLKQRLAQRRAERGPGGAA